MNYGQPCYRSSEKSRKKFVSEEAGEEHLQCELEVFGKLTDDRFKKRGIPHTINHKLNIYSIKMKKIN